MFWEEGGGGRGGGGGGRGEKEEEVGEGEESCRIIYRAWEGPQPPGHRPVLVRGLLGTGLHSRRWTASKRVKLHLLPHHSHYHLRQPPPPPLSVEELSSTKPVPGTKKVGDRWFKQQHRSAWFPEHTADHRHFVYKTSSSSFCVPGSVPESQGRKNGSCKEGSLFTPKLFFNILTNVFLTS